MHPWVTIAEMNGEPIVATKEGITDAAVAEVMPPPVSPGTVLFSFKLSIGKTAVAGRPLWTNEAIAALPIRRPDLVTSDYLKAVLAAGQWETESNHAVLGRVLNKEKMLNLPIRLPSLAEQRRIVGVLDRAASIRRLRRQAQEKAQQIIPVLFIHMFGDPGVNPHDWPVRPLGAVADVASGVTKGRRLNGAEVMELPYLRVANVQDGFLDLKEVKTIQLRPEEIDRFRLVPGDLMMTEGGDPDKLGRGAIWDGQLPYCAHQNHVFRVRADRRRTVPRFLSCLAGSNYGKSYFLRVAKRTTGIASINKTQLSAFTVPLPPLELQEEFERRCDDLVRLTESQSAAVTACEAAVQALQTRLFA